MENYIPISNLNDFCFCPYSIYLHNIYYGSDEGEYQASPQTIGKEAHSSVNSGADRTDEFRGLCVFSEEFGLQGKIDVYKKNSGTLIERKYRLKNIYQGQKYQLWAQYFCMQEMGYKVNSLAFMKSPQESLITLISTEGRYKKFKQLLTSFHDYSPAAIIEVDPRNAATVYTAIYVTKRTMTMYTSKDIECKTVFVINCIEKKELHVKAGGLMLEDAEGKTLTKLPFQKILALFIIGNIHITTPLIDKCKKFNVSIIVTNTHFRPVFYWANEAEANYLLRQKQYCMDKENTTVAKVLVKNKIVNQISTLKKAAKQTTLLNTH